MIDPNAKFRQRDFAAVPGNGESTLEHCDGSQKIGNQAPWKELAQTIRAAADSVRHFWREAGVLPVAYVQPRASQEALERVVVDRDRRIAELEQQLAKPLATRDGWATYPEAERIMCQAKGLKSWPACRKFLDRLAKKDPELKRRTPGIGVEYHIEKILARKLS